MEPLVAGAWHLLSIVWPVLEIYSQLQKLVTTKLHAESVTWKSGLHHKIIDFVEGVPFTSQNSYHCCNYSAPCTDHSLLSLANEVTMSSHQFQTI
jgi:hypothetical protein